MPFGQPAPPVLPAWSCSGESSQSMVNPFTPKSDQCQISPAASPIIVHHTVWITWLFIAYSDERWLHYQFSLPHLYIFSLKGSENVLFELRSERVNEATKKFNYACPSGTWPLKSACPAGKSTSSRLSDTVLVEICTGVRSYPSLCKGFRFGTPAAQSPTAAGRTRLRRLSRSLTSWRKSAGSETGQLSGWTHKPSWCVACWRVSAPWQRPVCKAAGRCAHSTWLWRETSRTRPEYHSVKSPPTRAPLLLTGPLCKTRYRHRSGMKALDRQVGNRRWTKCAACHLRTNKVTIWPLNRSRGANPALPPPRYYSHPVPSSQPPSFLSSLLPPAVALTRTSAYITHKNLDVRKIMEAMRTAHAKNGTQVQHISNKTWRKRSWNIPEHVKGKRASLAKNILFPWIFWWT